MSDAYMFWIAAAVVVSAIALLTQAVAAFGMYRSVKKLEQEIVPLVPDVRETLDRAQKTLSVSLERVEQLSQQAHSILETTQRQLAALDATRQELTVRVQSQMERIELVLDDSMSRVQEVVSTVHRGVIRPVREVAAVAAGVRAAIRALAQGRRPSVAQATHDEEMFI